MSRYIISLFLLFIFFSSPSLADYNRVVETNTLRCGYGEWVPGVYKDLETGQMKGIFVDLINTLGQINGINELVNSSRYKNIMSEYQSLYPNAFIPVTPTYLTR